MEEQVIKSLLEFYKEQGLDLYAVLDDPLFTKLDLSQKVKLIKEHASDMYEGTKKGLSKNEIRSILVEAGLAGGVTGLLSGSGVLGLSARFGKDFHLPGKAIGLGLGLGALIGGGTSALSAYRHLNTRKSLVEKIRELKENPTNNNAIKLMAFRNQQVSPNHNLVMSPGGVAKALMGKVQDLPGIFIGSIIPDSLKVHAAEINEHNEYNRENTPDEHRNFPIANSFKTEMDSKSQNFRSSIFK